MSASTQPSVSFRIQAEREVRQSMPRTFEEGLKTLGPLILTHVAPVVLYRGFWTRPGFFCSFQNKREVFLKGFEYHFFYSKEYVDHWVSEGKLVAIEKLVEIKPNSDQIIWLTDGGDIVKGFLIDPQSHPYEKIGTFDKNLVLPCM
jgi:hypothetical protein